MIPSVVAQQARETILDYLRTTFALADDKFADALFAFLDSEVGLFRGPYLDVRRPFRKATEDERVPLDIRPGVLPYKHQLRAFQRLYSRDGHQPQHTLVTTGTGSGKTECFLYPALDHCWRNRGKRGIKAILLYPMNALASDQARRVAQTLWDDERLRGHVTAGLYVGGKGQHGIADREHLVDKRELLRDSPPDILLTNYKMLDFLLLRPDDRRLWRHNGAETLRYLVLDELHTYDGAQGSDVACLLRRLKDRLGCAAGSVCCVGTSATIGGGLQGETVQALTSFASKVFDEEFFEDAVITEDRCSATETLGETVDIEGLPSADQASDLDPQQHGDVSSWLRRQAELWLGGDAGGLSPVDVGDRLRRHDFLRQVLKVVTGAPTSWVDVDAGLMKREPEWGALAPDHRWLLLSSMLGLVSHARTRASTDDDPERTVPFLAVQCQLWVRELRRLVQKVAPPGESLQFAWVDDGEIAEPERDGHWLPIAHCRECGSSGLASLQRESESVLKTDVAAIGRSWLNRSRACRYVAFGHTGETEGFPDHLCPQCLSVQWGETAEACGHCRPAGGAPPPATVPVRISRESSDGTASRFLAQCPECGSDHALSMLGSRAPSLLSVAISHLYQTDYNDDKKLIAFTDSVQDASHRAGFFGARTYRFNLRTAFQAVIEANPADAAGIPLSELSDRLWDHWSQTMSAAELIPTLLPADLRELPAYERFLSAPEKSNRRLQDDLRVRLSWEAVLEYGLNARVGRTLESTLCSTVVVDREAVARAAEILGLELQENSPLRREPAVVLSPETLDHFLAGFLQRLRLRGGIDHTLLRSYARENGSWFLLTKRKNTLMSPFGRASVLPRFLTDQGRAPGSEPVFDAFLSQPTQWTWYRDWASRVLGVDRADEGINELYRESVRRLEDVGLLVRHDLKKHGSAWALDAGRLRTTAKVRQVFCPVCRRRVMLAASEAQRWAGRRCTQYRCEGGFELEPARAQSYYGRIYRSGRLKRIFTQEHTGLLARDERERVEEQFKRDPQAPGAPNLLVATPTLELGIDIGELSAAMLCSVPPTTANYLQRVGRTGRKTGNAFCLTLANSRPHDLYFQSQPLEMIAGPVLPPGCFLDAPEMLRRQLVAHAMDAWARREDVVKTIPHATSFVLGEAGRAQFPGRFLRFFEDNRKKLTDGFLDRFHGYLSEENAERLREFASGDAVRASVDGAFEKVAVEIADLRGIQRKARDRIREIEDDPEIVDRPDEEKVDLEDTTKLVARLILEQSGKYPLNVLTDEGVLPNYAFPEPGVRLESVVGMRIEDGTRNYETKEYIRPASSAIRELAPFNTFYADGRKVRIDQIDVGTTARPLVEIWRLCPGCSHTSRELDGAALSSECPRCGDLNWSDAGQVRQMVHFRRSRSLATRLESSTVDDSDDREEAFYDTLDLIDVGREHWNGAKLLESMPFGWELLKGLTLRELNVGQAGPSGQDGFKICGQPVGARGFEVCLECGRVRDGQEVQHAAYCRGRKAGYSPELVDLFLYREIESEAIRILLPVSEIELERKRASFKAALQLGFRRHFQGDPGHLVIKSIPEPVRGGYGNRQFLVVFDAVPGGTGYLSELWQKDNFLAVLEEALKALQACVCQRLPNGDGCYRCLYAYQAQRDLAIVSSREAQRILKEILDQRAAVMPVHTLSEVTLESKLESELEEKFLRALKERAGAEAGLSWDERLQGGELRWTLRTEDQAWEIVAQVDLGPTQGVALACRPDFLIRPANGDPAVRSVAVFCDGLAFHACPGREQGRIGDDIRKRSAVLNSGRFAVWSVTWRDVEAFQKEANSPPTLFREMNAPLLGQVATRLRLTLDRGLGAAGNMEMLLAYLRAPDVDQWRRLADAYALGWLAAGPLIDGASATRLERRLHDEKTRFQEEPAGRGSADQPVIGRQHWEPWFTALARCSTSALRTDRPDDLLFVLRLFDEGKGRQDPEFEAGWRAFLQAWNLLQFHQKVFIYSSELLENGFAEATSPLGGAQVAAEPAADEWGASDDPALKDLLRYSTSASKPIIQAVSAAGVSLPVYDFELTAGPDRCGAEPELAWPTEKVAVLAERQQQDRPAFEAAGWTVFVHPVPAGELVEAVRRRGAGSTDTQVES